LQRRKRHDSLGLPVRAEDARPFSPAPGLTYELTRKFNYAVDSGQKASDLTRRVLEIERGREFDKDELYKIVRILLSENV
jgi:hypothetical protein